VTVGGNYFPCRTFPRDGDDAHAYSRGAGRRRRARILSHCFAISDAVVDLLDFAQAHFTCATAIP
jgi:hypothetical protein